MPTRAAVCHGPSRSPERSSEWMPVADLAIRHPPIDAESSSVWQDEEDAFNEAISRILLGEQMTG